MKSLIDLPCTDLVHLGVDYLKPFKNQLWESRLQYPDVRLRYFSYFFLFNYLLQVHFPRTFIIYAELLLRFVVVVDWGSDWCKECVFALVCEWHHQKQRAVV